MEYHRQGIWHSLSISSGLLLGVEKMSLKILEKCEKPYISKRGEIFACGQCPYCVRRKVMEWTIRANHELLTTEGNKAILLTLTYDKKHLVVRAKNKENSKDRRGVIVPEHMTLFIKRFRKFLTENFNGKKIRFIYTQEYGTEYWRPHAHAVIFGLNWEELHNWTESNKDWIDERNIKISKDHGEKNIEEAILRRIWKQGKVDVDIREMHENCLQYVVGYVQKKIGNLYGGEKHYEKNNRPRPYMRTSQGIGKVWAEQNINHWINTLTVGWNGKQVSIPRYYLKKAYEKEGKKIAFQLQDIETKEKRNYYYILKNPDGFYTKKIQEVKLKKRLEERKKQLEKEKADYQALQKYYVLEDRIKNDYLITDFERFERFNKNSQHLIQSLKKQTTERILERVKREKLNKNQTVLNNLNIMTFYQLREFYKKAKEKAEYQNDKLRRCDRESPYGNRNKYERNAEFEDSGFNEEITDGRVDPFFEKEDSKINWNNIFSNIKVKKEENPKQENLFS